MLNGGLGFGFLVIGALILILLVSQYGFISSLGVLMMLFGGWNLYQAYVNPQAPSIVIPIFGIPIYTGLEKTIAMLTAGIFIVFGAVIYHAGRRRSNF